MYFILFIPFILFANQNIINDFLNLQNKINVSKQHHFSDFQIFDNHYVLDENKNINGINKNCIKKYNYQNEIFEKCLYYKYNRLFQVSLEYDLKNINNSKLFNNFFSSSNYLSVKYENFSPFISKNYSKKQILDKLNKNNKIDYYLILKNEKSKIDDILNDFNYHKLIHIYINKDKNNYHIKIMFINIKNYIKITQKFYRYINKGI